MATRHTDNFAESRLPSDSTELRGKSYSAYFVDAEETFLEKAI
jgi:hypothetical protein